VNPGTGEPLPALWIKKSESLAELREGVEGCMLCPLGVKGGARFQGRGDVGARLLLAVGVPEAAAVKDGDFLTKEENALLEAIISKGLKLGPTDVYVMPVVKCPRQVEDFLPLATTKVCANISLKEIRLVAPKAVVSFGLDAARLLSKEGGVLDALRRKKGRTLESGNSFVPFRMTMGLDSMLEFPELKKDAWQDLQEILRLIG
jgi:uracil-DNA glycosylase family 4